MLTYRLGLLFACDFDCVYYFMSLGFGVVYFVWVYTCLLVLVNVCVGCFLGVVDVVCLAVLILFWYLFTSDFVLV